MARSSVLIGAGPPERDDLGLLVWADNLILLCDCAADL